MRLQLDAAPGHSSLAANWRMDFRVDRSREEQLNESGSFPSVTNSVEFSKAITDYFSYHQCRQAGVIPEPGYSGAGNMGNLIPVAERPSRNHHLLHIASINSLLRFVLRSSNPGRTDFLLRLARLIGGRPITTANMTEIDSLADSLNDKGADTVKEFARAISDALGPNEPHWWAAFSHEVRNFAVTDDWTGAVQTLGLGHLEPGERLLAWHYSPEMVGQMFRPTVAEARDSGFHFPSPPGAAYGIAMPLASGLATVKELVHAPLKGILCNATCTGRIGRIDTPPVPLDDATRIFDWFTEKRISHRTYLSRHFLAGNAQRWLTRHADLP